MSTKKLFDQSKQAVTVGKYLRLSSPNNLGDGIESEAHLKQSLKRQDEVLPPINYANPEEFVKFGSAEQYYKNAFEYVLNYYPYDGSNLEKVEFYNDLNPVEQYFIEEVYPRSTGFISNGVTYGAISAHPSGYASSSAQYIQVKGGPHKNTLYDEQKDRTSNLEFGGSNGTTVEFFYRKESAIDQSKESPRQVVIDLWNGEDVSSSEYGRLRIEVATGSADHFEVTFRSGSSGFTNFSLPTSGSTPINDDTWRNFSFVFNTSTSTPTIDFFANGRCIETGVTGSSGGIIGEVTGTMIANLGALRTAPAGIAGVSEGYGKLSASLDEFRFWKTARNDEQIGRYWFDNVGGGTNKYDANVSLGAYFKFNEGVTETASIDRVVMDYSGRLSNGLYIGYSANARNTGSAINQLNLESIYEEGDPVVRASNPFYKTLKAGYLLTGSNYDAQNNARLLNHLPNWIIEEEEKGSNEIVNLTQIMASYFDTIYNQLTYIKNLRFNDYISGSFTSSMNEFPYNDRLVENLGIEAPELFANAGTLQQFLKRDEQINFDNRLENIKNSIYKNIYNNLNFILKSKGNEKSIRNFIRCLGVDEEIIALNTYPNNADFELVSNYKTGVSGKKFADFTAHLNQADDEAIVYQYYDSSNANSVGVISGSSELDEFAFTLQSEIIFPLKQDFTVLGYDIPSVVTASLMGFHTPADSSPSITDTTWAAAASDYGLQVQAIKAPGEFPEVYGPPAKVKDAYFLVKDREGKTLLTSSIFNNVYDNSKWNLALSLKPVKYPFSDGVTGTSVASSGYTLELYGVNYDTGTKRNSFSETTTISATSGSNILQSAKKVYLGASRTNFTGSTLLATDIRGSSVRFWSDYIPNATVDLHAKEVDTYGRLNPYRNTYEFQTKAPQVYIPKIQTLALNWDFANITGSDSSGRFIVTDFSSGSNVTAYPNDYQGPVFSNINLREHTGRGDFFKSSFTPVRKQYVYTDQLQIPEYVGGDNMVNIPTSDDETFGIYLRPVDFFFAVERSMYRSISNRMLDLFASIEEFNNLVGEPVNKYRLSYKRMEKLREIFFRRVKNEIPEFDKYLRYYKWLDDAMGEMIQQLFPVSAKYAPDVRKIVESHVLERPKIQHKLVALRDRHPVAGFTGSVSSGMGSVCRNSPGWQFKHAPIPLQQDKNCEWWRTRAERNNVVMATPTSVLNTRNAVLGAVQKQVDGTNFLCVDGSLISPIYGGINQYLNKKRRIRDYTFDQFKSLEDCQDVYDPLKKKLIPFRATKDGVNYKGAQLTPFTAISSSLTTGYNAHLNSVGLSGISLNNLHEDSIFPYRHSVPLQGPFTERWVGGIQARHVAPFRTADRREEYNLTITSGTGSVTTIVTGNTPKGQYLRGLSSKSPVNIANIKTIITGSSTADGVRKVGNYERNYEVVQGNSRFETNIDFVFNNSRYQYSMPSAFITPPDRRTAGRTGSADYPAPRQISSRRKTDVIFVDRFASPGSKQDSKQQFRDVNSDQFSPNSALPFRNLAVRNPYLKRLGLHSTFGGYQYDPQTGAASTTPSATKIQRNTVLRLEMGFSGALTPTTVGTASVYDDGFVTRPVPSADRSLWTSYISGSDNAAVYNQYVALGSRYPANITFVTQSATAYPLTFANSLFTNSAGNSEFVWANNRDYVSWKQMRAGDSRAAQYYKKHNLYELLPEKVVISADEIGLATEADGVVATKVRTLYDRNGNAEPHYYSQRFREAPLTSRYSPLLHQLQTPLGTPSKTENKNVPLAIEYTYGNMLMGFANRELNLKIDGRVKFAHGMVKRPYEILRDQFVENVQRNVNGAELIKDFTYKETIHPKEVYTYLSQSRSRLAFVYSHWKDDTLVTGSSAASLFTNYKNLISTTNRPAFNRQSLRIKGDFVTSQKYSVLRSDQEPYEDPSAAPAGPGSGSIWPLDSYLYSDVKDTLVTILTASMPVLLADAGTMAAGELMMTHYGTINDRITDSGGSFNNGTAKYVTSSINSAQYLYNVPVTSGSVTTISAVAARASITASYDEGQGITPATAALLFGSAANDTNTDGQTVEVTDTQTRTLSYKFERGVEGTTFDSGLDTYTIGTLTNTASPVAAQASITASYDEGQEIAAATATLLFGADASGDETDFEVIVVEDDDTTRNITFEFDVSVSGTTFDSTLDSYIVGTKSGSAGELDATETRDALLEALGFAAGGGAPGVTPSSPLGISVAANGSLGIDLTADTLGTSMNTRLITYTDDGTGSTQIDVTSWAGGEDYTYGTSSTSKTLTITDDVGIVTYTFDSAVDYTSSTSTVIGTNGATSGATASEIAAAIRQTINLSQGLGNINVTAGTVVGNTVPLTADNAGVDMNGKAIGGTAEADGGIVAADFAGGSGNEQLTPTEVRDALFSALEDSATTPTDPIEATVAKNGSLGIDLTATVLGTDMNTKTVTYTNDGSASTQIDVTSWAGGADYTYNSKTLDIDDDTGSTVSYIFDVGTAPGSSTSGVIGTSGPATAAQIAGAIRQTINLSQGDGDITVTAGTVVGNTVPLVADNAGVAMNGEPIAGTAEADGGIVASAFAGGVNGSTINLNLPSPRSPGSVYTRPSWTAGINRLNVDGPNKRLSAGTSRPFYNTYEDYVENIRLVGKEKTILPEFRISEHIYEYERNGNLLSVVSSSLELTGASETLYNGINSSFYQRFVETDQIEFLEDFMPEDLLERDFIFNNYPRHFELGSEAIVKLLPYDGFYPVNRTVEIAALFREAYAPNAILEGPSGSKSSAWRSILRPFFAPGIMYNSIKSGVAVDYPIRRTTRNVSQFLSSSSTLPLHGCLSGTLSSGLAAGSIPGNRRRDLASAAWSTSPDINKFFWADRLPFETIIDPVPALKIGETLGTVNSDINEFLFLDASGSLTAKSLNDSLYKKAVSNFIANVPRFFLKKKPNKFGDEGHLTKFVSQFGSPPKNTQQNTAPERTVEIEKDAAYMMEVGLLKTDNFNMYSNPYAFGIPTSTGSVDWSTLTSDELPKHREQNWPKHRGEFAPFTPPYYYGPSLVRILFMPRGDKPEYTLDEIINNDRGELFVQYLNESGSYYDMTSGSFIDRDNNVVESVATPSYGWNRAWQNRMDIDASINIFNSFPTSTGTSYKSTDPNKWTIMPKWETPILDFPSSQNSKGMPSYEFSSSVALTEYTASTQGMWHQYGVQPDNKEGVYLYLKDIPTGANEEYDFVAITYDDGGTTKRNYKYVKKVPKFVTDANRSVKSLAELCGFDSEEIIRSGIDFSKAKRMGELGENNEKSLSEAVLAMPVYYDKDGKPRFIPIRAPADKLGPKIKEFRKQFTKFSLPPSLSNHLMSMVPKGYPNIPDYINPFGPDEYDEALEGTKLSRTPVVYLLEHKISLSKQDLADMWQGVMPDIAQRFNFSYAAIDHYLPGDNVEEEATQFPEVLKEQIVLNIPRNQQDGHPRYDLLDISGLPDKRGIYPEIRWLVFKVKERGLVNYDQMIIEEVDGTDALSYEKINGFFSTQGFTREQAAAFMGTTDRWSQAVYRYKHSLGEGSYNWPYDYFSLVELGKLNTKFVFRPELKRQYEQGLLNAPPLPGQQQVIDNGGFNLNPLGPGAVLPGQNDNE